MGRGGGEGRVPSLMTAAVEREVPNSYFFSFFFDVSSMGHHECPFVFLMNTRRKLGLNAQILGT
jgi:hypothetical protein